jgi:hypothetical protein
MIDSLTPGAALSATQAALWVYGNRTMSGKGHTFDSYYAENLEAATALYNLLLTKAEENNETTANEEKATTLLTTETFATDASITLHNRVTSTDEQTAEASDDGDYYNTDLSFSVKVQPSSITGNLLVTVYQDGKTIGVYNLTDDNNNNLSALSYTTNTDDTVTYTIPGITLKEGAIVTLNLKGTQNIERGVYIYMADASQTFVGLADGSQDVNLNVELKFEVEEPDVQIATDTKTSKTETEKTDSDKTTNTKTQYIVTTETDTSVSETSTINTKVYADVKIVNTSEKKTTSAREWESTETVTTPPTTKPTTPSNPSGSESPAPEESPKESEEPETSPSPEVTEEPEESPEPEETEEPENEPTPQPEETATPTETPSTTPSPDVVPTTTPAPSETPATPIPSETPVNSATPNPTSEPNPTATPTSTPNIIDKIKPTPSPDGTPQPSEKVYEEIKDNLEDEHEKKKEEIENREYDDPTTELEDLEELREIISMRVILEKAKNPDSDLIAELEDEMVPLAARIMELIDLDEDAASRYAELEAQRKANEEAFHQYLIDIGLEDVPLSGGSIPGTGDTSIIWTALAVLSISGLAALSTASKKRKNH